jgi:hypothetical protein
MDCARLRKYRRAFALPPKSTCTDASQQHKSCSRVRTKDLDSQLFKWARHIDLRIGALHVTPILQSVETAHTSPSRRWTEDMYALG